MSYCALVAFVENQPRQEKRFSNAWGGAARIWSTLYAKYLFDPAVPYDNWGHHRHDVNEHPLWKLAEQVEIPFHERAVLASTFDYYLIKRENFLRFADDLQEFLRSTVSSWPDGVSHLGEWIENFRWTSKKAPQVQAVGFVGTSVAGNLWLEYDEERDEDIPYDLSVGTKHREVYEWLESLED